MNKRHGPPATFDQVADAIERLTDPEWNRLRQAASKLLWGKRFASPDDLVNETLRRLLEQDRKWPIDVPFVLFMINAMRSVADGIREVKYTKEEVPACELVNNNGGNGLQDPMEQMEDCRYNPPEVLLCEEQRTLVENDLALIEEKFTNDDEVMWILLGIEEHRSAREIREISGMTLLQYEAARKRLHRGLEQLFPGRRHR